MGKLIYALLFLGFIAAGIADEEDKKVAKLIEREEKLEKEIEKLAKDLKAETREEPPTQPPPVTKTLGNKNYQADNLEVLKNELKTTIENDIEERLSKELADDENEDIELNDARYGELIERPQNSPFFWGRRRRRFFRAIGRFVRRAVTTSVSFVRRVVSGVTKIWGQYKFYSECIRNAALLAQAAGDEEEYHRLTIQADEAERIEADVAIKSDMRDEVKQRSADPGWRMSTTVADQVNKEAKETVKSRQVRSIEGIDDAELKEIENEVEEDVINNIDEKSDAKAKPFWRRRRRRRRRRTVGTVIRNVCKWINAYGKYVLMAISVAG